LGGIAVNRAATSADEPPVRTWKTTCRRVGSGVLTLTRLPGTVMAVLVATGCHALAFDADVLGLAALSREQPALDGSNVFVGLSEGQVSANAWQVNPSVARSLSIFTWVASGGSSTNFTNAVGIESWHANLVGTIFFGTNGGVAPGVARIRNYDAGHYVNNIIAGGQNTPDMIVNQSWIAGQNQAMEEVYDNYAATRNILFVSGVNNAYDTPPAPAGCYNGIAVGSYDLGSSIGPTADGRAKPDLVFPNGSTSYCTPVAAGAAAILLQAAMRSDGGSNTIVQATNVNVLKALLLNGATKPPYWTNGPTRPLDARWGAGIVNVYQSWRQLAGGRTPYVQTNYVLAGAAHPPTGNPTNLATRRGWDLSNVRSTALADGIAHYFFDLPAEGVGWSVVATLVWKKPALPGTLRDLDLFLFNAATSNLVASSTSSVDNVEHIFANGLPAGRYDLQVMKRAGGLVPTEQYALAFDFASERLSLARAGGTNRVSWPVHEAGFALQFANALESPVNWQNVTNTPFVSNGVNTVTLASTNPARYFRLRRF
jgi:hypothetical protein